MKNKQLKLKKWQIINLVIVGFVIFGTLGYMFFEDGSITGFVPAVYSTQDTEVLVLKHESYMLSSGDDSPLHIESVFASGKIVGDGVARMYLEDGEDKYLIYSNEQSDYGLLSVTGFAIKDTSGPSLPEINFVPEGEQNVLPDFEPAESELYPDELKTFLGLLAKEATKDKTESLLKFVKDADGFVFDRQCTDTCALFGLDSSSYRISFDVDSGTVLLVDELVYSIETGK